MLRGYILPKENQSWGALIQLRKIWGKWELGNGDISRRTEKNGGQFWKTCFNNQFNAQFFYSITICMLFYNPRHVLSSTVPIFRRTNCIITASGIVDESRLLCILLSSGILYSRLQRVTIPDAVIIQFVLLKMGTVLLKTCRGL